tara:strand:- start:13352 stop:13867 length:516 start_codon:yes stop_codon:yes gene_type:complete
MPIDIEEFYDPIRSYGECFFGLSRLENSINEYPITLDADFQRGHVWTEEHQINFMSYLLSGGAVPPCYANIGPNGTWRVGEMVDGKQRVTACIRWRNGEIPAIINDKEIRWNDLNERAQRMCSSQIGLRIAMLHTDRKGALEVYIKINSGGVVHTKEEIDRVRRLLEQESE